MPDSSKLENTINESMNSKKNSSWLTTKTNSMLNAFNNFKPSFMPTLIKINSFNRPFPSSTPKSFKLTLTTNNLQIKTCNSKQLSTSSRPQKLHWKVKLKLWIKLSLTKNEKSKCWNSVLLKWKKLLLKIKNLWPSWIKLLLPKLLKSINWSVKKQFFWMNSLCSIRPYTTRTKACKTLKAKLQPWSINIKHLLKRLNRNMPFSKKISFRKRVA